MCEYCGKKFEYRIAREAKKRFCTRKCSVIFRNKTEKQKKCTPRGENHYNWKGGESLKRVSITPGWRKWRKKVYERDKYTCQECGEVGGNLNPHHIKPVALFPNLVFEVDNGITLCRECHKRTDTFGLKMVWRMKKAYSNVDCGL